MWEAELVIWCSDRYKELQADGWEPTNFILVPDPRPKELVTLNGDFELNVIRFVGMKKRKNPVPAFKPGVETKYGGVV